jgi:hypothetical protein
MPGVSPGLDRPFHSWFCPRRRSSHGPSHRRKAHDREPQLVSVHASRPLAGDEGSDNPHHGRSRYCQSSRDSSPAALARRRCPGRRHGRRLDGVVKRRRVLAPEIALCCSRVRAGTG